MNLLRSSAILIGAGLALGLYAVWGSDAMVIFLFFTLGHALIACGIGLYVWDVWRDLREHDVL